MVVFLGISLILFLFLPSLPKSLTTGKGGNLFYQNIFNFNTIIFMVGLVGLYVLMANFSPFSLFSFNIWKARNLEISISYIVNFPNTLFIFLWCNLHIIFFNKLFRETEYSIELNKIQNALYFALFSMALAKDPATLIISQILLMFLEFFELKNKNEDALKIKACFLGQSLISLLLMAIFFISPKQNNLFLSLFIIITTSFYALKSQNLVKKSGEFKKGAIVSLFQNLAVVIILGMKLNEFYPDWYNSFYWWGKFALFVLSIALLVKGTSNNLKIGPMIWHCVYPLFLIPFLASWSQNPVQVLFYYSYLLIIFASTLFLIESISIEDKKADFFRSHKFKDAGNRPVFVAKMVLLSLIPIPASPIFFLIKNISYSKIINKEQVEFFFLIPLFLLLSSVLSLCFFRPKVVKMKEKVKAMEGHDLIGYGVLVFLLIVFYGLLFISEINNHFSHYLNLSLLGRSIFSDKTIGFDQFRFLSSTWVGIFILLFIVLVNYLFFIKNEKNKNLIFLKGREFEKSINGFFENFIEKMYLYLKWCISSFNSLIDMDGNGKLSKKIFLKKELISNSIARREENFVSTLHLIFLIFSVFLMVALYYGFN